MNILITLHKLKDGRRFGLDPKNLASISEEENGTVINVLICDTYCYTATVKESWDEIIKLIKFQKELPLWRKVIQLITRK